MRVEKAEKGLPSASFKEYVGLDSREKPQRGAERTVEDVAFVREGRIPSLFDKAVCTHYY